MGRLTLLLAILAMTCTSCARCARDMTLYQRGGRQKAIVAVLPSIVHSGQGNITWDLSREFTEEIRKRVYDSPNIYLLRDGNNLAAAEELNTPNPNDLPMSVIESLGAAEYVVVTELVDQSLTPIGAKRALSEQPFHHESGSILSLAMRVRVIDLRHDQPRIILQEVIDHDHIVSRAYLNTDYAKAPWGSEAFLSTPMGTAHHRLIREISSRVEDYIEASR